MNDGANPASGIYDLRFAIYDALAAGTQQGSLLTNSATAVSNGLFTVTLDFRNQFPGASRWLEIGVRTNGTGIFSTLSPRQKITPSPYAITAGNVISGGLAAGNVISNGVLGGTIAGGGAVTNHLLSSEAAPNTVLDNFSTVGGGLNNTAGFASADFDDARGATVAGGSLNKASILAATVGGGFGNTANGGFATIAGGYLNTASGDGATVPGGFGNHATGSSSFAAGFNSYATNDGTFVWADSTGGIFASSGSNQFLVRATGGVGINTPSPGAMLQLGDVSKPGSQEMIRLASRSGTGPAARYWDIGVPEGDENTAGKFYSFVIDDPQLGTAPELVIRWDTGNVGIGTTTPAQKLHVIGNILASGTVTGSSDRNVKEHFSSVNPRDVLEKVSALLITEWNYICDGETLRHIGPMAQDFYSAFNVGLDDKHISMVDADGVALAAIQGLSQKLDETVKLKDAKIQELEQRLEALEKIIHPQKSN